MIIVGYNPRPLGDRFSSKRTAADAFKPAMLDRFSSKRTAADAFKPSMLDALYRAIERNPGWSPSLSIVLFGQTAEDFAEEHWA